MDRLVPILSIFIVLIAGCKNQDQEIKDCNNFQEELEIFLPEITAEFPRVRDMALSPDGMEMMITVESYRQNIAAIIIMNRRAGECWSNPQVAPFSGHYRDIEPHYSQDGQSLFFASNRPLEGDTAVIGDYNLFITEKKSSGWSTDARLLPAVINTENDEFYPSVSQSGNIYFTAQYDGGIGREDIYLCQWNGTTYEKPICLERINSPYYEFNAFVSPDEEYIIYTSYGRPDGMGGGDLYISFHQGNNTWTEGINMGETINSPFLDFCPFVDPKEGILYFTSDRTDIHDFYENRLDIESLKRDFNSPSKGVGRLYTIPFDPEDYR